ncbi:MAG: DUF559 domain-containing protein [Pseudomonadota bacterium]|nr:DUF559 domain-containing protein [Pseudomonadota bacterium]
MSIETARQLRSRMTEAEKRLWSRIRYRQVTGARFRRQQAIGPWVVDFFCPAARLVIEVDGGQHVARADADLARTTWLAERGYRVIRFWNNDVLARTDAVVEEIARVLAEPRPDLRD